MGILQEKTISLVTLVASSAQSHQHTATHSLAGDSEIP